MYTCITTLKFLSPKVSEKQMYPIEQVNIRLVGLFNAKIFQPIWVKENLYNALNLNSELELSFKIEDLSLQYNINDIMLLPSDNFIDITYHKIEDSAIIASTKILLQLLNLLSHAPIKAIGFNINIKVSKDIISPFTSAFKSSNTGTYPLIESKYNLMAEDVTYYASVKTKKIDTNNFHLNFNYHYPYQTNLLITKETLFNHIKQTQKYFENT